MFRQKAVDVNGAIDQLRASEIAAQQIWEIEQGHTEESIQFAKKEKPKRKNAWLFVLPVTSFINISCVVTLLRLNQIISHWKLFSEKNILAAPKRLQRMLLWLQKYQLQVCHKVGPVMYIADFLSRIKLSSNHSQAAE